MLNNQAAEKRTVSNDGHQLDLHSIFYTIQGEGPFCGTPAVFIRLAGCNLKCPGCDTDYTVGRKLSTITSIVAQVMRYPTRLVVITGGEPFRQNIQSLVECLVLQNRFVQIETNGTLPASNNLFEKNISIRAGAYLVCSPKTPKVHVSIQKNACAFKYVLSADSIAKDGLPINALNHIGGAVARPDYAKLIYVQPMDAQDEQTNQANLRAAVTTCMQHGYIFQLQVHKIIGVS